MKKKWNLNDTESQFGKSVLITGANDGLGYELTRAFVSKKAQSVIMACRDLKKAETAKSDILKVYPDANLDIIKLDLSNLQTVKAFAQKVTENYKRLDIIMCNAGIMAVPYNKTTEGIEMQMGVNFYGHYALLGLLMPLIKKSPAARIVTTSSLAEKLGKLNLSRPDDKKHYSRWRAYGDSKLAVLMFALMLDKKFKENGINAIALSAHPGIANTNLRRTRLKTEKNPMERSQLKFFDRISMPADQGMLPLLFAATDAGAEGGQYIGVSGFLEIRGYPKITRGQKRAYDVSLGKKLWLKAEKLTGIIYDFDRL